MTRKMAKGLIAGAVMLALAGCKSDDDVARELLANALQQYSVVQNEALPTADRLVAGREVVAVLDRIVADYGTTDLGLQIAAGGNFGAVSRRDLADQIIDLEMMRENELCDEQPTAGCIVRQLAVDIGLGDPQALFHWAERIDAGFGLMLALASGDSQGALDLLRSRSNIRGSLPALALAMAPLDALDDRTIDFALRAFDDRTRASAAFIALHRIASGADHPALRAIVADYQDVPDLLTLIDPALSFEEKIAWIEQVEGSDNLHSPEMFNASNLLALLGRSHGESIVLNLLVRQHGASAVMAHFSGGEPDFDFLEQTFGRDAAIAEAARALQDPASSPRTRSLALMYAALHLPVDDLRSAVNALAGLEVMTWDNIRVFAPLVALGHIGDRALFDSVAQFLTTTPMRASLEKKWQAGRMLAEGRLDADSDVLSDPHLFRATVTAADARATRAQFQGFLLAAAQFAGATPGGRLGDPVGAADIAQAALNCGVPAILAQLPGLDENARLQPQICDRARLGATVDLWTDDDFSAILDANPRRGSMAARIIAEAAQVAPVQAYAFARVGEGDDRLFATALLAMLLASGPPPG